MFSQREAVQHEVKSNMGRREVSPRKSRLYHRKPTASHVYPLSRNTWKNSMLESQGSKWTRPMARKKMLARRRLYIAL